MNKLKELIRSAIRKTGYDIKKYKPSGRGQDPYHDMKDYARDIATPTCLDIGANVGQTIQKLKWCFDSPVIHSFEPSGSTFSELQQNAEKMGWQDVTLWNKGVGSENGKLTFVENEQSYMSSFLEPGSLCTGKVSQRVEVDVVTLDSFAEENSIQYVDVLKSDTQGFDFEVLKGADRLMSEGRIGLVYFEFIFSDQYQGVAGFDEVFRYLRDRHFRLASFYRPHFQRNVVSWTDMLFISEGFLDDPAHARISPNQ